VQMIAVQGLEEEAARTEGTSLVVASLDISLVALGCIEEESVAWDMHMDRMKEQVSEAFVVAQEERESLQELVQQVFVVVVPSELELVEELSCRLALVQISST